MNDIEFFEKYSLNEEQTTALKETDGAVLVSAGAGSGKTRLLTHRISYLMQVKNVSAYNILAITFTNKAAAEMKQRVEAMIPEGGSVWISTFHSMCAKILRNHISKLDEHYTNAFTIYSESDCDKVLKDLFEKYKITDENLKKTIKFHISNCKNRNIDIDRYERDYAYLNNIKDIMRVFRDYEEKLKANNALDFDDLLIKTYELFRLNDDVLNHYSNRFKYILVDEFQDTNTVQFDLVKLLSSKHKNIFVVGDEDQCIYTWRGASFKNIYEFEKNFESVKVFKLERNYRSSKPIIELANKVIENNTMRLKKTLWTDLDGEDCIHYYKRYDEREEANEVARRIHNYVESGQYDYGDFAILMRVNALSRPFEEKLLNYNIPHRIYGGYKFFERQEIKNVLSYLRLFVNVKDDVSFSRIINFPKRGIGNVALEKLANLASLNNCSLMEMCLKLNNFEESDKTLDKFSMFTRQYMALLIDYENLSLSDFVKDVISKFNIKQAYFEKEEDIEKTMNIDSLVGSVIDFEMSNKKATLVDFLENVSLISDIDTEDGQGSSVTIATVHAVKGLEFKVVFVVGLEETIFPLGRARDNPSELEEERRLMYVAITRAREQLYFLNCEVRFLYGRQNYMMPSRFLAEAGLEKPKKVENSNFAFSKAPMPQKFDVIKPKVITESQMEKKVNDISKFRVGQTVMHPKFGVGIVEEIDSSAKFIDITFGGVGKKTLLIEIAPLKIIKG